MPRAGRVVMFADEDCGFCMRTAAQVPRLGVDVDVRTLQAVEVLATFFFWSVYKRVPNSDLSKPLTTSVGCLLTLNTANRMIDVVMHSTFDDYHGSVAYFK